MRQAVVSGVICSVAVAACGGEPDGKRVATWYGGIQPLLVEKCGGCHTDGGAGPFPLDRFADAVEVASVALEAVEANIMPPWGAQDTDECTPPHAWKDDLRLSDDDKRLLREWVANGQPLGDEATALPVPTPPSLELTDPTSTTAFRQPFSVPDIGQDVFECFVLDPGITEQAWITGVQINPGNREVAHHALVFLDNAAESESLATDGHFPCFSNPDFDVKLVGAWAPGALPFELPEKSGIPISAGARLVVQMHYHPHYAHSAEVQIDQSSVSLRLTHNEPKYEAILALLGNDSKYDAETDSGLMPGPNDPATGPEFLIPAGAKDHVETIIYRQNDEPFAVPVFAVGAHMHYVGVDMKIDHLDATAGEKQCLLQTPKWNFNWQRTYRYDAEIDDLPAIRPGDSLSIRCTYDNTMDNPFVVDALREQNLSGPVDVGLGEQTLDEMCLGVFGVLVPPGFL